jgi:hypothetical protein
VEFDGIHWLLTLHLLVCCVQKHDYDAVLVGAFRREQEKEAELKATIAAKQIAEQLVRSSPSCVVFLPYEHLTKRGKRKKK